MGWQDKLWAKVDRRGDDECWPWLGKFDRHGYGRHWHTDEGDRRAHRLVYQLTVGPIPSGLGIDHLCRNRWCVNPGHLEPVTGRENSARIPRRERCPEGHVYDERNTHVRRNGKRECRTCIRDRQRERRRMGLAS